MGRLAEGECWGASITVGCGSGGDEVADAEWLCWIG